MIRYPQTPRELILWSSAILGFGLCVPLFFLALPRFTQPSTLQSTTIIRVQRSETDEWQPPALRTEYEAYQAAVMVIPDTVPITTTEVMSETAPRVVNVPTSTGAAMVMSEELFLRDGPGTNYIAVDRLGYGRSLQIVSKYNTWYEVITDERIIGWIERSFVSTITPPAEIPDHVNIPNPNPALIAFLEPAISGANLRPLPSLSAAPIAVLRPNEVEAVTLLTRFDTWFQVQTPNGSIGWLANELLNTDDYVLRRVPILTASPYALEAVAMARQYIGYPYIWGAESPRVGFDCSGLVKYIYGQLGISLPHSSAAQWDTNFGRRIYHMNLLLPGDVVFFENTYKPGVSHVGIYAGGGYIIQAISESVGIQVSSFSEPYWSSRFVGGIRPFE